MTDGLTDWPSVAMWLTLKLCDSVLVYIRQVLKRFRKHLGSGRSALLFWWGETESTSYCGHYWPIVPAPDHRWWLLWSSWWNEVWQGKPKYLEETCPSTNLSTANLTWPDPGSNPDRCGGKPATNRLSYGAASVWTKSSRSELLRFLSAQ
jgi:hypothetical protein